MSIEKIRTSLTGFDRHQQSQSIHRYQHCRAGIRKDGWPQTRNAHDCRDEEHSFEPKHHSYVLLYIGHCALGKINRARDIRNPAMRDRCTCLIEYETYVAIHGNANIGTDNAPLVFC